MTTPPSQDPDFQHRYDDWTGAGKRGTQPQPAVQSPEPKRRSRALPAAAAVFVVALVICIVIAAQHTHQQPVAALGPGSAPPAQKGDQAATPSPSEVTASHQASSQQSDPSVTCYGTKMAQDKCQGAKDTSTAAFLAAYGRYSDSNATAYCKGQQHPAASAGEWVAGCEWDLANFAKGKGKTTAPPVAGAPAPAAPAPGAPAATAAAGNCNSNYGPAYSGEPESDWCIPPGTSDVDCAGGSGNGPRYIQGPVKVTGTDEFGLDSDHDGIGCES